MATMVGKEMKILFDLGDGRSFEMDGALIRSFQMSTMVDTILPEFAIELTAPYIVQGPSSSEVIIEGYATDPFLNFIFDEEKAAEHGLVHGVHFCKGCGSDWVGDGRIEDGKGNCGYCGAPRHWDRAEGDSVPGLTD